MQRIYIILAAFLLNTGFAFAGDTTIDEMQIKYSEMSSFECEFEQELYHRESQSTQKREGVISFEKPFLLNWDTQEPMSEYLIVTDKEIWNYFPEEELAYRYSLALAKDSQSMLSFLTGKSSISNEFEVEQKEDMKVGNEVVKQYVLYPFKPSVDMIEAQLWIYEGSHLIYGIEITDFYGNKNKVLLKNVGINPELDGNLFKFIPPEGTDIEDHTGETSFTVEKLSQ